MDFLNEIKFDEKGLVPAIAQDYKTNQVLMMAYMNKESLEKTIITKQAHYYSRSRNTLWLKGETSGHFQNIRDIRYDCDCDTILLIVEQEGAACHTGEKSCFYRSALTDEAIKKEHGKSYEILYKLYDTIIDRKKNPKDGSYTNYLFEKGNDKILKKIGEEAAEVIIATKNENREEMIYEVSDLIYHLSVGLVNNGLLWDDVFEELKKR